MERNEAIKANLETVAKLGEIERTNWLFHRLRERSYLGKLETKSSHDGKLLFNLATWGFIFQQMAIEDMRKKLIHTDSFQSILQKVKEGEAISGSMLSRDYSSPEWKAYLSIVGIEEDKASRFPIVQLKHYLYSLALSTWVRAFLTDSVGPDSAHSMVLNNIYTRNFIGSFYRYGLEELGSELINLALSPNCQLSINDSDELVDYVRAKEIQEAFTDGYVGVSPDKGYPVETRIGGVRTAKALRNLCRFLCKLLDINFDGSTYDKAFNRIGPNMPREWLESEGGYELVSPIENMAFHIYGDSDAFYGEEREEQKVSAYYGFGDWGSCFINEDGCNSHMRKAIEDRGIVFKLFKEEGLSKKDIRDPQTIEDKGLGRFLAFPTSDNLGLGFINWYQNNTVPQKAIFGEVEDLSKEDSTTKRKASNITQVVKASLLSLLGENWKDYFSLYFAELRHEDRGGYLNEAIHCVVGPTNKEPRSYLVGVDHFDDDRCECCSCESRITEDDSWFTDNGDGPYCRECYSDIPCCPRCEVRENGLDMVTLGNGDEICTDCLHNGDYSQCSYSEEYYPFDELKNLEGETLGESLHFCLEHISYNETTGTMLVDDSESYFVALNATPFHFLGDTRKAIDWVEANKPREEVEEGIVRCLVTGRLVDTREEEVRKIELHKLFPIAERAMERMQKEGLTVSSLYPSRFFRELFLVNLALENGGSFPKHSFWSIHLSTDKLLEGRNNLTYPLDQLRRSLEAIWMEASPVSLEEEETSDTE